MSNKNDFDKDEVYKAARMYMNKRYPFFGSLFGKLSRKWTDEVPTLATDGKRLMINEEYFEELYDEDKMLPVAAIIHEIFHCVMDFEIDRSENVPREDHRYWNAAEDYHINGWLDQNGFPVDKKWLFNPQYFRNDLTVEALVEILKQENDDESDGHCGRIDPDACNGKGHGKSGSGNQTFNAGDIISAHTEAEMSNRNAGNMPGELSRMVDEMLNPPINWDRVLRQYIQRADQPDWRDFSRPNRRQLSGTFSDDVYLPVDSGEQVDLIVYIDTSGSIRSEELAASIGLINQLCKTKSTTMKLIWWDTKLHPEEKTFSQIDFGSLEPKGGGGTNVQPVVDHHNENSPIVSVVFTDGYFSVPDGVKDNMLFILYEGGSRDALEAVSDKVYEIENRGS